MTKKPNVIVILADQLRADCISLAGNADINTPVLDDFATDGVHYENAYATAPLCVPSRYSLLTGLYPRQHGVDDNGFGLPADLSTFPEVLRNAGYRTTAVGKMHFTPTYMDAGFQELVLAEQNGQGRLTDDYHRDLMEADLVDGNDLIDQCANVRSRANALYFDSFGAARSDLPERWHSTNWITDRALEQIDQSWSEGGRLLCVSYVKPHHPFDPPAPWDSMYDPKSLNILPGWTSDRVKQDSWEGAHFDESKLDEMALRNIMALYYGTISHMDSQIGRILSKLRTLGVYDDSLIVFTADHGEYLGFHHLVLKHGLMYDPVIRVPLIIKYPGLIDNEKVDVRFASGVDLFPTILAATNTEHDLTRPGLNLKDQDITRSMVFAESADTGIMVRSESYKMLVDPVTGSVQVFDLQEDPFEMRPLTDERAKEVGEEMSVWLNLTIPDKNMSASPMTLRGSIDRDRDETLDAQRMVSYLKSSLPNDHIWMQMGTADSAEDELSETRSGVQESEESDEK